MSQIARPFTRRLRGVAHRVHYADLISRTGNFSQVTWLGMPVWQDVRDLWTIQETIAELRPDLLVECGTNRGGTAVFYGQIMDLLGQGHVVSIDVEKLHDLAHPRVRFLIGSSTSPDILTQVNQAAAGSDRVLVILDSDHSYPHVARELEAYAPLVTPGSWMLCQDGIIDTMRSLRGDRPGPLPAIREFLDRHPEFEVDHARTDRYLVTHHPMGWLRRAP